MNMDEFYFLNEISVTYRLFEVNGPKNGALYGKWKKEFGEVGAKNHTAKV